MVKDTPIRISKDYRNMGVAFNYGKRKGQIRIEISRIHDADGFSPNLHLLPFGDFNVIHQPVGVPQRSNTDQYGSHKQDLFPTLLFTVNVQFIMV